jgi:hypothetical protein
MDAAVEDEVLTVGIESGHRRMMRHLLAYYPEEKVSLRKVPT